MSKMRTLALLLAGSSLVALVIASVATYQFLQQPSVGSNSTTQTADLAAIAHNEPQVLGETTGAVWFSKHDNTYSGSSVISFSSIEEPVIKLSARDTKTRSFTVSAYPINKQDLLGLLLYTTDTDSDGRVTDSQFRQQFLDTTNRQPTATTTVTVRDTSSVSLPLAEQGMWYVYVTNGDIFNRVIVIRSAIGTLVKSTDSQFLYWSEDFKTRQVAADVTISQLGMKDTIQELGQGQTDAEGLLRLPYSTDVDIALAEFGEDIALIPVNLQNTSYLNWKQFGVQSVGSQLYLFSDRALYQPGDTVNYKAIVRESDDGQYSLPSGTMYIRLQQGNEIILEEAKQLSSWGALDGSIKLDKDTKPGSYILALAWQPADPNESWHSYNTSTSVEVAYYTKPDYHLELTGSQMAYVKGDTISALIEAQYFSGQPIANGSVSYSLSAYNFSDYDYLSQYYTQQNNYRYGWWDSAKPIQTGTIELDSKGSAVHMVDTAELMAKDGIPARLSHFRQNIEMVLVSKSKRKNTF